MLILKLMAKIFSYFQCPKSMSNSLLNALALKLVLTKFKFKLGLSLSLVNNPPRYLRNIYTNLQKYFYKPKY